MLLPAPPLFPKKRKPKAKASRQAPVAAGPVLVSAAFGGSVLTMTFDRAIDVAGLTPGQVVIDDGPNGVEWAGTAEFEQLTPQSVSVTMIENTEFAGAGVTLTATGGAGIMAQDGESAWAGVTGVELPFP
jgi:hypothetical protein